MKHGQRLLIGALVAVALATTLASITTGEQALLAVASIIYVDADAGGTNDGSSWTNAHTDLQAALTAASSGTVDEIWVAAGTYRPTSGSDRYASFQMINDVAIYGGFDPSVGDDTWEERDWENNETLLSGDIGAVGDSSDNSYHVLYHPDGSGLDSTAILDGFTVSSGNANGTSDQGYGGGIYNSDSSPRLSNCTFSGNSAIYSGGGMYNDASSPTLTRVTFISNSSEHGGGMYNLSSSPVLTDCTFTGNSSEHEGGGMYNVSSSPVLTDCTFTGNSSELDGGAMYNSASPTLTNCTFSGNSATGGAVMFNDAGEPVLTNCTFAGNLSRNITILNNVAHVTLTNCIVWEDSYEPIFDRAGYMIVTYSNVKGGVTGTGNIDEDPLFVDPASGNVHLRPGSPCIDAGSNDAPDLPLYDFEGDDRTIDGDGDGTATVDMGADEAYWYSAVYLPFVLRNY